jgi:hypothetical protein
MGVIRLTSRPRTTRGRVAVLGALFLMVFYAQLVLAAPAGAGGFNRGLSSSTEIQASSTASSTAIRGERLRMPAPPAT